MGLAEDDAPYGARSTRGARGVRIGPLDPSSPLALWVTPGVTVLGVIVMVFVSAKAETFQDAQQMSVCVVLPILLLILGQASGLFLLEEWMLLLLGLVVLVLDVAGQAAQALAVGAYEILLAPPSQAATGRHLLVEADRA